MGCNESVGGGGAPGRSSAQQAIAEGKTPATKPSNPKDNFGAKKASLSYVSAPVLMEVALGMQEGGYKYGRHNYRVIGVRGSIYYDAAIRHLMAWWEGEELDFESGAKLHHVSKAIASLVVLRDAMLQGKFTDDRPPRSPEGWMTGMNAMVEDLCAKFPQPVAPYTQVSSVAQEDKIDRAEYARRQRTNNGGENERSGSLDRQTPAP